MSTRTDILKKTYNLRPHEEGGSFSEVYTSPEEKNGRSLAGSIYFLLDRGEVSQFHQIDCDEGYAFVSCVTVPKFSYEGFRLVSDDEIQQITSKR